MELNQLKLIESLILLALYTGSHFVLKNYLNNALKNTQFQRARRKMIIKILQLLATIIFLLILGGIWGLDQKDILIFVSSVLTVFGIAFFAQWSILSNITAAIILYFHHPLKIGDTIKVIDKDFPFEGEITNISYFYIYLKTHDDLIITLPNNIALQKSVAIDNLNEVNSN
jgi:small-conductance mechanosensitive channel